MTRSATALATTNPPGCICPVLGREGCPQHSYAGLEAMAAGLRVELERLRAVPFCGWCGHLRHDRADERCWANVGGASPEPCDCGGPPEEDQP